MLSFDHYVIPLPLHKREFFSWFIPFEFLFFDVDPFWWWNSKKSSTVIDWNFFCFVFIMKFESRKNETNFDHFLCDDDNLIQLCLFAVCSIAKWQQSLTAVIINQYLLSHHHHQSTLINCHRPYHRFYHQSEKTSIHFFSFFNTELTIFFEWIV